MLVSDSGEAYHTGVVNSCQVGNANGHVKWEVNHSFVFFKAGYPALKNTKKLAGAARRGNA
jgi:hypothetical protein